METASLGFRRRPLGGRGLAVKRPSADYWFSVKRVKVWGEA